MSLAEPRALAPGFVHGGRLEKDLPVVASAVEASRGRCGVSDAVLRTSRGSCVCLTEAGKGNE